MWRYIVMRVLSTIPVIGAVGIITFSMLHIAPGNPAYIIAGEEASLEVVRKIEKQMGFDKPFIVQFGVWVGKLFKGDLGKSVFSQLPVGELMLPRIQPTLSLGIQVIVLSMLLGVPMGIIAAWKAGRAADRTLMMFAVLGFSIPGFWLAFLLMWGFAVNLRWFPVLGYEPISSGLITHLHSMFLPVIVNAVLNSAFISRITRSIMLEVLREDYIRTARAKGLGELVVYLRHAFRNACIPVLTLMGAAIAGLATGAVVTETIFAIPGLGRMLIEAIARRDFPIIQGMMMVVATFYVLVNLVIDIAYAYLDPRIRY